MSKPSRRNYTEEFKREAVKLVEQGNRSVSDVARNLGVHRSLIERWRQQYGESSSVSESVTEAEREEEQAFESPLPSDEEVSFYNADGFIDENPLGAYSFNNITAKPNDDGSITIHFGGCDDGRVNCLPIAFFQHSGPRQSRGSLLSSTRGAV